MAVSDKTVFASVPDWRILAEKAAHESDPAKLMRIVEELCRALDRREEQANKSQAA